MKTHIMDGGVVQANGCYPGSYGMEFHSGVATVTYSTPHGAAIVVEGSRDGGLSWVVLWQARPGTGGERPINIEGPLRLRVRVSGFKRQFHISMEHQP